MLISLCEEFLFYWAHDQYTVCSNCVKTEFMSLLVAGDHQQILYLSLSYQSDNYVKKYSTQEIIKNVSRVSV